MVVGRKKSNKKVKKHMKKMHKTRHHKMTRHNKMTRHHKKSRHNKSKKNKKTRRVQKGGYGKGACPLAGKQWNPVSGGNFFKLGTPIGVGGTPPYPGMVSPSPQHPFRENQGLVGGSARNPLTPAPILNGVRGALGGAQNFYRQLQGLRPLPSPEPWKQDDQQL